MKTTLSFALAGLLLLAACDSIDTGELDDPVVVEAFLFAGEPIDDIHLSSVIPIDSEDAFASPINDADVRLVKNGVAYTLTPSGTEGYYHYAGDDLRVEIGDVFQLDVEYGSTHITAETTVPLPPTGVDLTVDTIVVPNVEAGMGAIRALLQSLTGDNTVSITWNNPDANPYFVVVQSPPSDNPDYILPEFVRERFAGIRLVSEPTTANFFDIRIFSLEVVGSYDVTVYRINQEYADLYENRAQDSRDLNEPPTNIEGGLGVFSAFNGQGDTFLIVRE